MEDRNKVTESSDVVESFKINGTKYFILEFFLRDFLGYMCSKVTYKIGYKVKRSVFVIEEEYETPGGARLALLKLLENSY